ncbi:MAG: NAD-dependent epimerase/dehydratase family protein [Candidatus Moranbacteria bacterium]|nr:NAD-dependent epimerase/dehydratase family protein [Candidatus Moranbacteria bacterium]
MKMCITGGSGFIGSHLVRVLNKSGNDIIVVDRIKPDFPVKYLDCDISKAFEQESGIDIMFHYAASPDVRKSMENPVESLKNNVIATQNVLEFCRKNNVKKIVFASTSAVYGNADKVPITEEAELKPVSVYGATKASCEMLTRSYHETYGIDAVVLRYANIYGPGSTHGVMHDFFQKLVSNPKILEILGDGNQSKSYLYIDDAIRATMTASKERGWNVINVGSEKETSVKEIAFLVASAMNLQNVKFVFAGGKIGWKGDVPRYLLDIKKIQSLGWREQTEMNTGINNYIQWLSRGRKI